MKILSFLQSLLPSFGRDQVLEDCRITQAELTEGTIPSYAAAAELFTGWKFKAKDLQKKAETYARITHTDGRQLIAAIHRGLKQGAANLLIVEDMIRKSYTQDVAASGLTYQKAQLLQFVEFASFASKYARKFLIQVYVQESATLGDGAPDESLAPAELKWLEDNWLSFCSAMNVISTGDSKLRKAILEIPDIMITQDNAATLGSTMGQHRLDPLQFGLIPLAINPIYHIRMAVAEWQAGRYKAAHMEVKLLQLRKLNLERLSQGKPDAKLQQEIEYLGSRIGELNYKLQQMEQNYA